MDLVTRIKQLFLRLISPEPSREVFRIQTGRNKSIVGVEQTYILRIGNTDAADMNEIRLPKRITSDLSERSELAVYNTTSQTQYGKVRNPMQQYHRTNQQHRRGSLRANAPQPRPKTFTQQKVILTQQRDGTQRKPQQEDE